MICKCTDKIDYHLQITVSKSTHLRELHKVVHGDGDQVVDKCLKPCHLENKAMSSSGTVMALCMRKHAIYFQIPATTTRILLNHFKWDKEKLMERFYDGDQDQLFSEARVINPFRKPVIQRPKV